MKRWKTRQYYQLKDYCDIFESTEVEQVFFNNLKNNMPMYFDPSQTYSNYRYYPKVFYYHNTSMPHAWRFVDTFKDCFMQIVTRHQEDIIFAIDEDEDTDENRKKVFAQFILSFIFIAQQTADKYAKLLEIYTNEKDKLMDALENITSETHQDESSEEASNEGESSRSGSNTGERTASRSASRSAENEETKSGSKSGTQHQDAVEDKDTNESSSARSRYSDTPEMSGMYDDDKYTTNLTNGDVNGESDTHGESTLDATDSEETSETASGTNNEETSEDTEESSSGTTSETASNSGSSTANRESSGERQTISKLNPMTIMARIKEIDDNYRNIMLAWVNEFDRLFIDGCNV